MIQFDHLFQLPGGWGRCPQAGATGSLEGYDLWLEVPLELYIIPQCQRVNTTPRLSRFLDEADNQEFILIFLGSQFNARFYLFPLKGALIVGTKNSRKAIITRQIGKASTTEPIGQPLAVSKIKPERYQDLIRNLFSRARCRQQGISTFEFPFYFDLFCILFYWKFNPQRWTGE